MCSFWYFALLKLTRCTAMKNRINFYDFFKIFITKKWCVTRKRVCWGVGGRRPRATGPARGKWRYAACVRPTHPQRRAALAGWRPPDCAPRESVRWVCAWGRERGRECEQRGREREWFAQKKKWDGCYALACVWRSMRCQLRPFHKRFKNKW